MHGIKSLSNNEYLKILYAYEALNIEKNAAKACSLISSVKKSRLSWGDSLVHYHDHQKAIHIELDNCSTKTLNVKEIVNFEVLTEELEQEILSAMELYLRFWEKYDDPNLMMQELIILSRRMDKKAVKIDSLWNKFIAKYPKKCENMVVLYYVYLFSVRNRTITATP